MDDKKDEDQIVTAKVAEDEETIKSVKFSPLEPVKSNDDGRKERNMDLLLDVHIPVLVELGKTEMLMREVLALTPGAIIELDTMAGEPVRITVRGKIIAYGEVVVVDENFGVRITRIASTQDRIQSMG